MFSKSVACSKVRKSFPRMQRETFVSSLRLICNGICVDAQWQTLFFIYPGNYAD
jgi:hypothetical protein